MRVIFTYRELNRRILRIKTNSQRKEMNCSLLHDEKNVHEQSEEEQQ